MGQAREEMHDNEAYNRTMTTLVMMGKLLGAYPHATIKELHRMACDLIQHDEEQEELARKMEKDD